MTIHQFIINSIDQLGQVICDLYCYWLWILFHLQLKGELCQIFGDDDIPQNIRSKFQKTWGPKILKYAEQKKGWSSYLDEMKAALTEEDINPTGTVSKRRDSWSTVPYY